jgi:hypothetical protein
MSHDDISVLLDGRVQDIQEVFRELVVLWQRVIGGLRITLRFPISTMVLIKFTVPEASIR